MSKTTETRKRFDVLQPIERKNGQTYWMRIGTAFENVDGSINVYLDAYPINSKLQVRQSQEDDKDAGHREAPPRERNQP